MRFITPINKVSSTGTSNRKIFCWATTDGFGSPILVWPNMTGGQTVTVEGMAVGTPAFMPPEQAKGQRCDARSDVYSLGASLYHLLSGRAPFEGQTPVETLMLLVTQDPVPLRQMNPHVPKDLEAVVHKAMEKSPRRRYPSARALSDDLGRLRRGEPVSARPIGLAVRVAKWGRRHRTLAAFLGLLAVSLVAATVGSLRYAAQADRARAATEVQNARLLVTEGQGLGQAGRWYEARSRFDRAGALLRKHRLPTLPVKLGRLLAELKSPGPLWVHRGHLGDIRALALSPDNRWLVSGGYDGNVKLWDFDLGQPVRVLVQGALPIRAVDFDPSGSRVLFAGHGGQVGVVELSTSTPIATPMSAPSSASLWTRTLDGGNVHDAKFSPDGQRVVLVTEAGVVYMCRVQDGDILFQQKVSDEPLHVAGFLSRDNEIVVAGNAGVLTFLDGRSGDIRRSVSRQRNIRVVDIMKDDTLLVAGMTSRRPVVLDVNRMTTSLLGTGLFIGRSASALQDDRPCWLGSDGWVHFWDVGTKTLLRRFRADAVGTASLSVSSSGDIAVTGSRKGLVQAWPVPAVRWDPNVVVNVNNAVRAMSMSDDNNMLMVLGPGYNSLGRPGNRQCSVETTGPLLRLDGCVARYEDRRLGR